MKHYKILLFICVIAPVNCVLAQDLHFSQFHQTPLLINPALTGTFNGDIRAQLNYKDQWRSMGTPYKTFAFSADAALFRNKWENSHLGVGLSILNDKAGDSELGLTNVNLSVSGIVSINSTQRISGGVQGGFAQKSIDYTDLQWDQSSPLSPDYQPNYSGESNASQGFSYADLSAGVLWIYTKKETSGGSKNRLMFNAGLALHHINRPGQEFYSKDEKLNSKLVFHGGSYIGLRGKPIALLPTVLFLKQGPNIQFNLGTMVRYQLKEESKYTGFVKGSAVSLGAHFRTGDALIPSFMFEMGSFAVGISYDVNISRLKVATAARGGIEISLRYVNPNPFRAIKYKHTPLL